MGFLKVMQGQHKEVLDADVPLVRGVDACGERPRQRDELPQVAAVLRGSQCRNQERFEVASCTQRSRSSSGSSSAIFAVSCRTAETRSWRRASIHPRNSPSRRWLTVWTNATAAALINALLVAKEAAAPAVPLTMPSATSTAVRSGSPCRRVDDGSSEPVRRRSIRERAYQADHPTEISRLGVLSSAVSGSRPSARARRRSGR